MRDGCLGDGEGGPDVYVHGAVKLLLGRGQDVAVQHDARVVHHAVQSLECQFGVGIYLALDQIYLTIALRTLEMSHCVLNG